MALLLLLLSSSLLLWETGNIIVFSQQQVPFNTIYTFQAFSSRNQGQITAIDPESINISCGCCQLLIHFHCTFGWF